MFSDHGLMYVDHSRLLLQMARHIEMCNKPEFKHTYGSRSHISTNDYSLVTTLFNSIYGHPVGRDNALQLSLGIRPGEYRQSKLADVLSIHIASSEFDGTVTYTFVPHLSKELQTMKLMREAAEYAARRADSYTRVLAPPTRTLIQLER